MASSCAVGKRRRMPTAARPASASTTKATCWCPTHTIFACWFTLPRANCWRPWVARSATRRASLAWSPTCSKTRQATGMSPSTASTIAFRSFPPSASFCWNGAATGPNRHSSRVPRGWRSTKRITFGWPTRATTECRCSTPTATWCGCGAATGGSRDRWPIPTVCCWASRGTSTSPSLATAACKSSRATASRSDVGGAWARRWRTAQPLGAGAGQPGTHSRAGHQ